ncbi:MAG TPA: hypothetical protein VFZ58_00575 [Candidatus Saccharimonadales bacterium]
MINAVLSDKAMSSLFPETSLSEATERFLQLAIGAEVKVAETVLEQQALLKEDPRVFLASLCEELTEEEREVCLEGFDRLQSSPVKARQLLRRLSGEPIPLIAADCQAIYVAVLKAIEQARKKWYGKDRKQMQLIAGKLTPCFPKMRKSIVEDLPAHLPYINQEVSMFAERFDDQALAQFARSLTETNMTSPEALLVLAKLNATRLADLPKHHPLRALNNNRRQVVMKKFESQLSLLPIPQPYAVYENSDEATRIILSALAAHKTSKLPPPSLEDITSYAKDIEASVLAEELLKQNDQKELRQLVELGKTALHTLLASHVGFVGLKAGRLKAKMESWRDTEELILVGMRGLLRAIRKYDYQRKTSITTLSDGMIKQFVTRDIIRNEWQLPIELGEKIIGLKSHRLQLTQELQAKPSFQALAERMNLPPSELNELLMEEKGLENYLYSLELNTERRVTQQTLPTTRFDVETEAWLKKVLKTRPLGLKIIDMHFAQRYEIDEIAEALSLSPPEVEKQLQASLKFIASQSNLAELYELLTATSLLDNRT